MAMFDGVPAASLRAGDRSFVADADSRRLRCIPAKAGDQCDERGTSLVPLRLIPMSRGPMWGLVSSATL
jgi:hypothetical protein